jgi:hypothetical protein
MPFPTSQTRIDPQGLQALKNLVASLPAQGIHEGISHAAVLSALAMYTSPEQAAGMLAAYIRATRGHGLGVNRLDK